MNKVSQILAVLLLLAGTSVNAQIVISNVTLTTNSVSFDISGTFPSPRPSEHLYVLYFVDSSVFANPDFVLYGESGSIAHSFTGSQELAYIRTGNSSARDYFAVEFIDNDFAVGETINGSVAATWNRTVFDPGAVSSLNVFWGSNHGSGVIHTAGTPLTSVGVPEPSSLSLLLAGGAVLMAGRRRKA